MAVYYTMKAFYDIPLSFVICSFLCEAFCCLLVHEFIVIVYVVSMCSWNVTVNLDITHCGKLCISSASEV